MQVVEWNVEVAESAPPADTRSVCIIRTTVENISADTEHRACLLATAELLVELLMSHESFINLVFETITITITDAVKFLYAFN